MEVCQQLRPLIYSMSVLGFIVDDFNPASSLNKAHSPDAENQIYPLTFSNSRKRRVLNRLFCTCICCLLWLRTLSYIPSFWVGIDFYPGLTVNRVMFFLWYLQCSLNVTVMLHSSLDGKAFKQFCELWRRLQASNNFSDTRSQVVEMEDTVHADVNRSPRETGKRYTPVDQDVKVSEIQSRADRKRNCGEMKNKGRARAKRDNRSKRRPPATGKSEDLNASPMKIRKMVAPTPERNYPLKADSVLEDPIRPIVDCENIQLGHHSVVNHQENISKTAKVKLKTLKNLGVRENTYEKMGATYALAAWILIAINNVLLGLFLFADILPQAEQMAVGIIGPFGRSLPARLVVFLVFFIQSCAWILLTAFPLALCVLLRARFNRLTAHIAAKISDCGEQFPPDVERWRQEHLKLCQCVTVLDQPMGKLLLTSYTTNLPLGIFMLYVIVKGGIGTARTVSYVFWFISNVCNALFLSVAAASVHEAAHSPEGPLFFARADQADPSQLAQLQLFLCKLTGTGIGFTVMGICIVTKEMMLTLGGLLVTYFLVLLEFPSS